MFVLAFVVAGLVYSVRWLNAPLKKRNLTPERLGQLVEMLLYRGFDRAEMTIRVNRSERGLRLRKYIVADNQVGLRCVLPTAEWSAPYREAFRSVLQRYDVPYAETLPDEDGGIHALNGDLEDLARASSVTRAVFTDIYGVDMTTECFAYLERIHPGNVRIGWTA